MKIFNTKTLITIVIVGSCLKNMQPEGYKKVEQISENIYEYQQVIVEPNAIVTTDIDIYNTFYHKVSALSMLNDTVSRFLAW